MQRSTLAFVRALRPVHWVKNFLVLAAPASSGAIVEPHTAANVALAFIATCSVASAIYLVNDIADIESDRAHPKKRYRPIASRQIPVVVAAAATAALAISGLGLGWSIRPQVGSFLFLYALLAVGYSLGLKKVAVLDLLLIASGFVIRAVVGASAANVPVSTHFLTVIAFAALSVAAGKRTSELHAAGSSASDVRPVLALYTIPFLHQVQALASGGSLLAYSLWAFEQASTKPETAPWLGLSVAPMTLALLRYVLAASKGQGEAPERLLVSDRILTLAALSWAVLFGAGVLA